jgi:serine/threonine protein kinase
MALDPGTHLGPYEVNGQIGAGGMGEVYRATDTKLGRDVALKTLPAALAADEDRLARFEREAKLLASLNHPHIGASDLRLRQHALCAAARSRYARDRRRAGSGRAACAP